MFGVETWEGAVSIICVNGALPFTYIIKISSKMVLRARPVPLWTLSVTVCLISALSRVVNVKAVGSLVLATFLKVGHGAQRSSAIKNFELGIQDDVSQ